MSGLVFSNIGVHALYAGSGGKLLKISQPLIPTILEIFNFHSTIEQGYEAYQAIRESCGAKTPAILKALQAAFGPREGQIAMLLCRNKVYVGLPGPLSLALFRTDNLLYYSLTKAELATGAADFRPQEWAEPGPILDLTKQSRAVPLVAGALQVYCYSEAPDYPSLTLAAFAAMVEQLYQGGFLTTPPGAIDFGSFNRHVPFCPDFGYLRGTPIDRYYLDQFVAEIRPYVVGHTLEIGGKQQNQQLYGFTGVDSYRAVDLTENPGVDLVGDIHDPDLVEQGSLDSVVIFNVLEHCERPWVVVKNIYRWLRPGGTVFCMVPSAQRMHQAPKDYWRFFPDALESLFADFPSQRLYVYGNLRTSVAALMGIAAEELTREDLDLRNGEYPVATCMVARKEEE
jgi:SAM-dependent methyltransferase